MSAPTHPEEAATEHSRRDRLRHTVAAGVPLPLGVAAAALSWRLGTGTLADPGPGMWPLMVSAFLFERVGFEIPTMALLVLWCRVLGRESWRMTAAVAVGATAALYLLFITGLGVSLPHIVHT